MFCVVPNSRLPVSVTPPASVLIIRNAQGVEANRGELSRELCAGLCLHHTSDDEDATAGVDDCIHCPADAGSRVDH